MKDFIFKLRVLHMMIYCSIEGAIAEWKSDVWRKDLDSSYCCSGDKEAFEAFAALTKAGPQ